MPINWPDEIQRVLRETNGAMHYTTIAEKIANDKPDEVGANPRASVAVCLSTSINRNANSPFQRVGSGMYALRQILRDDRPGLGVPLTEPESDELESGALRALGMYWQRSLVNWAPTQPKLYGLQNIGAAQVDFARQIGVYLLHDRDRVIYVGRATDSLVARLKYHTTDRLGGRWDRFSWFGLLEVQEDGQLFAGAVPWNQDVVIETLEALLIECLEPPLNRKRGDNFQAIEYLQGSDPEIQRLENQRTVANILGLLSTQRQL